MIRNERCPGNILHRSEKLNTLTPCVRYSNFLIDYSFLPLVTDILYDQEYYLLYRYMPYFPNFLAHVVKLILKILTVRDFYHILCVFYRRRNWISIWTTTTESQVHQETRLKKKYIYIQHALNYCNIFQISMVFFFTLLFIM